MTASLISKQASLIYRYSEHIVHLNARVKGARVFYSELFNLQDHNNASTAHFWQANQRFTDRRKMTLDQLADATDSSKATSGSWRTKTHHGHLPKKLSGIAKALGVTVDYLLGTDEQTKAEAEDVAFFRKYTELPPETREQLREMAKILDKKSGLK